MTNIIDIIQAEGTLTTFTHALKRSELVIALREPGAYTVFAPNDAAFAQMKAEEREDLFGDDYNLNKAVKYHVVMGLYKAEDLLDRSFLKTMEGQGVVLRSSTLQQGTNEKLEGGSDVHGYVVKDIITSTLLKSITVNGATIIRANMRADNGLIHVIDKVLVPLFLSPLM